MLAWAGQLWPERLPGYGHPSDGQASPSAGQKRPTWNAPSRPENRQLGQRIDAGRVSPALQASVCPARHWPASKPRPSDSRKSRRCRFSCRQLAAVSLPRIDFSPLRILRMRSGRISVVDGLLAVHQISLPIPSALSSSTARILRLLSYSQLARLRQHPGSDDAATTWTTPLPGVFSGPGRAGYCLR